MDLIYKTADINKIVFSTESQELFSLLYTKIIQVLAVFC